MYQFRDPVHGFIELTEDELKIVNTAPFQRLRHIRQLATTHLVYHGAEHTRFGHSLGVMHLTSRVFDSIIKKTPNLFDEDDETNAKKIERYRQILRLIGLTHDLGHAPFSHVSEELFPEKKKHEDYTHRIICETEIRTHIEAIGEKLTTKYGEDYNVTPELICMIYEGEDPFDNNYIMPDFMFLKSFMDGELDCDKMDYLLRDSMYCGVTYGQYDLDRFIATLIACKKDGRIQLGIERGGVQALEEFILARYFMFIQVYYHKTRRFLDWSLVNAIKCILPNQTFPVDIYEYLKWDDNRILYAISESNEKDAIEYRNRTVMTCVYETPAHAGSAEIKMFKAIFNVLTKEFSENVICLEADKMAHKLKPMLFQEKDDSGKAILIVDEKTGELHNIMEESVVLESIYKAIQIKRIYAKKEVVEQVIEKIRTFS